MCKECGSYQRESPNNICCYCKGTTKKHRDFFCPCGKRLTLSNLKYHIQKEKCNGNLVVSFEEQIN